MTVSLEEFASAQRPRLVRSAVLMGCALDEAEDMAQTALLRCAASWDRVSESSRPEAYVYRVLVNVWKDSRARRWNGEITVAEVPQASSKSDADLGLVMRQALKALPTDQREVLVLRYYADLSEKETARALGVRVGTVKSRAARAIKRLSSDASLVEVLTC